MTRIHHRSRMIVKNSTSNIHVTNTVNQQRDWVLELAQNEENWGDHPEAFVHLQVKNEAYRIVDSPWDVLNTLLEIPQTDNEKN